MDKKDLADAIRPLHLSTGRSEVAERLRRLIESNHFTAGDRLPSERELAERLGVSRTIVREAISTLEAIGLIEVRHGSGSYITGRVPAQNLSSMWSAWYAAHRHDLIYLLQVREALEMKAAELATANATPEVVAALREKLDEMYAAAARNDIAAVAELDARFHRVLIEASGNPILLQLLSSLDTVLENDRIATFSLSDRLERSLHDHTNIIAAIERRDLQAVQAALYQHFESVMQDVQLETTPEESSGQDGAGAQAEE